ncbi:MAG TPA: hypothetical protein VEY09_07335 [Pyrinomonadaceae bacterium]|nr:hypothetical protein [Pyrinomonadaceae bacterium]
MSAEFDEGAPDTVMTDAESQEFGAQHGQDSFGHETGTSGEGEAEHPRGREPGEGINDEVARR